jgi:D-beta-D-heptose 7-phosphate kinase/D-beta-D-heptose 1-phosphate adenosyltransferase
MTTLPPLAPERARQIVARFPTLDILVVGDAMLDRFLVGRVTRISPEAPVPVVTFDHETARVGGAANVAHNIAALGGRAGLVAVTGTDEAAAVLERTCRAAAISATLIGDPTRPTTTKVRVVTERHQQVARVDYESDADIDDGIEARVIEAIARVGARAHAMVLSDYVKGMVSRRIAGAVVAGAKERGVPVLVDPKVPHLDRYQGATVITPNHHEAELATGCRVRGDADARAAAQAFRDRARCEAVLMTRGAQGMWLLGREVEGQLAAVAREVADVTGAGDTVIATMALALAAGAALEEAAQLANEAAGLSVARFGPATVTADELLRALVARATV